MKPKKCPLGLALKQAKREGKKLCDDCRAKIEKRIKKQTL
jgi:hypothetical protein